MAHTPHSPDLAKSETKCGANNQSITADIPDE